MHICSLCVLYFLKCLSIETWIGLRSLIQIQGKNVGRLRWCPAAISKLSSIIHQSSASFLTWARSWKKTKQTVHRDPGSKVQKKSLNFRLHFTKLSMFGMELVIIINLPSWERSHILFPAGTFASMIFRLSQGEICDRYNFLIQHFVKLFLTQRA